MSASSSITAATPICARSRWLPLSSCFVFAALVDQVYIDSDDLGHMCFFARRDIKEGAELTLHYGGCLAGLCVRGLTLLRLFVRSRVVLFWPCALSLRQHRLPRLVALKLVAP